MLNGCRNGRRRMRLFRTVTEFAAGGGSRVVNSPAQGAAMHIRSDRTEQGMRALLFLALTLGILWAMFDGAVPPALAVAFG